MQTALRTLRIYMIFAFFQRYARTKTLALPTPTTSTTGRPFRLLTWNILAPLYAPHRKYPWTDPSVLEWSKRYPRIIRTIQESQADIVCLQEVQMDLWSDFYRGELESTYTAVVQNMTCQHPVGCAVLLRKGQNWRVIETESRSRALIAVLEQEEAAALHHAVAKKIQPQRLYLAVVHLEAGYDKEETRWNQIKSLLKRLHHHTDHGEENPAVIIAGDFNTYQRSCPLFSILSGKTCSEDSKLSWKGLSHFLSTTENLANAPPWKSLLPLVNVHEDKRPTLTYMGGSVLDYIWVSPSSIHIQEPLVNWSPEDVGEFKKGDFEDELCPPQPWPSVENPSDHVPIGAELSLIQQTVSETGDSTSEGSI